MTNNGIFVYKLSFEVILFINFVETLGPFCVDYNGTNLLATRSYLVGLGSLVDGYCLELRDKLKSGIDSKKAKDPDWLDIAQLQRAKSLDWLIGFSSFRRLLCPHLCASAIERCSPNANY